MTSINFSGDGGPRYAHAAGVSFGSTRDVKWDNKVKQILSISKQTPSKPERCWINTLLWTNIEVTFTITTEVEGKNYENLLFLFTFFN